MERTSNEVPSWIGYTKGEHPLIACKRVDSRTDLCRERNGSNERRAAVQRVLPPPPNWGKNANSTVRIRPHDHDLIPTQSCLALALNLVTAMSVVVAAAQSDLAADKLGANCRGTFAQGRKGVGGRRIPRRIHLQKGTTSLPLRKALRSTKRSRLTSGQIARLENRGANFTKTYQLPWRVRTALANRLETGVDNTSTYCQAFGLHQHWPYRHAY